MTKHLPSTHKQTVAYPPLEIQTDQTTLHYIIQSVFYEHGKHVYFCRR